MVGAPGLSSSQKLNLELTAEQLDYQRLAREFARAEMAPNAGKFDKGDQIPMEILKQLASLGLVNLGIPQEFGGLGLTTFEACIVAEELSWGCSGIASASEASELALTPLLMFGSQEQKHNFLAPLAAKSGFAGLAFDDFQHQEKSLLAVPHAQGYRLSGTAIHVLNAHIADWLFLQAQIVDASKQMNKTDKTGKRWGAFIVPNNLPGFKVLERRTLLGRRAADLAVIECQDVNLPSNLQLKLPDSMNTQTFAQACARRNFPIIGSGCTGVARSALEHAISYAKERKAFGKPIAQHQGLAFMLADMAREVESSRLLALKAAIACDRGVDHPLLTLSCKAFTSDAVAKVTTDAVQIFGGYGYTREYPVEKLMRDAKVYQLVAMSSETVKTELGKAILAGNYHEG
jgi:acyl-CoA dehydrogenase